MPTPRIIPSIDHLRQRAVVRELETRYGTRETLNALRDATDALRARLQAGTLEVDDGDVCARLIEERVEPSLRAALAPSLRPVINGTGVIVHTNLGRAPLARPAIDRIAAVAGEGYAALEYDLDQGTRGTRAVHAAELLQRLTGAEAATVVNNNAGAVLLALTALAAGREVIISRGELVEIGGGFRIPDVLRQSGAHLREVGTTNKTRPADYAAAVSDRTALILRVHPSNFRIDGFSERPSLESITALGRRFSLPVVEDLGSGHLDSWTGGPALVDEPTVRTSVAAGVTVCCFSGDKLLGGPQAGVIVGRRQELDVIRAHPLMRALRAGKLTYAALEATLLEIATGRAPTTVPVLQMIGATTEALETRAQRITRPLEGIPGLRVTIQPGESAIGGGTTPGVTVPSRVIRVEVDGRTPDELGAALRRADPPVVARIEHDQVLIDLRTVQPAQDDAVQQVLAAVVAPQPEGQDQGPDAS